MTCCTTTCCGPGSYCCEHANPHTHDEEKGMRAKRLPVAMELLQDVLSLPDGACIIDVRKGDYGTVEFLVVDETFPMLPEGALAPLVTLELSKGESRWFIPEEEPS